GGGARYPYPKHVWSPTGGWWAHPANWRSNTVITFAGIFAITYGVWTVSTDHCDAQTWLGSRNTP
ncbi:hypothetical protein BD769DRAFT_1364397, partial [Suillus cothurnatus]